MRPMHISAVGCSQGQGCELLYSIILMGHRPAVIGSKGLALVGPCTSNIGMGMCHSSALPAQNACELMAAPRLHMASRVPIRHAGERCSVIYPCATMNFLRRQTGQEKGVWIRSSNVEELTGSGNSLNQLCIGTQLSQ